MEPFPSELEREPQNLNTLLDLIISPLDEKPTDSSESYSSAGRN